MARGADGSMLTERQLKELNRKRFTDAVEAGNLYNTGPITEDGGTGFGEDRWAAYFKSNPEEAPSDWTGDSKSYVEKAPTDQEFLAQMDNMEVYDDDGKLIYADGEEVDGKSQARGLTGTRDGEGTLKTVSDSEGVEHPLTEKPIGERIDIEGNVTDPTNKNDAQTEINKEGIRDKYGKIVEDLRTEREGRASVRDADVEATIDQEDSVENWTTSFEAMSPEMFDAINPEDVKDLSENAQTAYNQIKGMNTDLDQEVTEGMLSGKPMDEASKSDMMKSAMINVGLDDTQSAELLDKLKGICG